MWCLPKMDSMGSDECPNIYAFTARGKRKQTRRVVS